MTWWQHCVLQLKMWNSSLFSKIKTPGTPCRSLFFSHGCKSLLFVNFGLCPSMFFRKIICSNSTILRVLAKAQIHIISLSLSVRIDTQILNLKHQYNEIWGYICSTNDCSQHFQSPTHLSFIKSLNQELPEMCKSAANKPTLVQGMQAVLVVSAVGFCSVFKAAGPSLPQLMRY